MHIASFLRSLFWGILGFGATLEYLTTSGAKSDVIFLLGNPDFLYAYLASFSRSPFWAIWEFSDFGGI